MMLLGGLRLGKEYGIRCRIKGRYNVKLKTKRGHFRFFVVAPVATSEASPFAPDMLMVILCYFMSNEDAGHRNISNL